ncbi:MAG: hypothetical protein Q9160_005391 [Pyrenula sp. 1 TL-2023]
MFGAKHCNSYAARQQAPLYMTFMSFLHPHVEYQGEERSSLSELPKTPIQFITMHTTRFISGPGDHDPPFRTIIFSDEPAIVLMSSQLRYAWTALPTTDPIANPDAEGQTVLGNFIAANYNRSEDERKSVPQNPDKDDINSEWRPQVLEFWNHVFSDVSRFLQGVTGTAGHLHAPAHESLTLDYMPRTSDPEKHAFKENRLLIPTFLDSGVTVRVTAKSANYEGHEQIQEIGQFDGTNTTEIWYVRRDVELAFSVEGDFGEGRNGVAAVFACGRLCTGLGGHPNEVTEATRDKAKEANEKTNVTETNFGD